MQFLRRPAEGAGNPPIPTPTPGAGVRGCFESPNCCISNSCKLQELCVGFAADIYPAPPS